MAHFLLNRYFIRSQEVMSILCTQFGQMVLLIFLLYIYRAAAEPNFLSSGVKTYPKI